MRPLDPILHSQLRLSIISTLLGVAEADFVFLRERTNATSGNLSVQIDKLAEAGYIEVEKENAGRASRTTCRITEAGRQALEEYVTILREDYLANL